MQYSSETNIEYDEATFTFEGKRIELLAIFAILDLGGYTDFFIDEEGVYLTVDIDDVRSTLTALQHECEDAGITLEEDTWVGSSYTYGVLPDAYEDEPEVLIDWDHSGSNYVWPLEDEYEHLSYTVPQFAMQLEMF